MVNENVVATIKEYDMLQYGKRYIWGMKVLNVYRNFDASAPTVDVDPNGTKYMVTTLDNNGLLATSTFFSIEAAENYMHDIVGGFYTSFNNVMAIEVNFKSQYSY